MVVTVDEWEEMRHSYEVDQSRIAARILMRSSFEGWEPRQVRLGQLE